VGKKTIRNSRRARSQEADVRFVKQAAAVAEYLAEPKPLAIAQLHAKTENQERALKYLNSDVPLLFLIGSAGTGKSFLAAYRAATLLKQKQIDKIYIVRPNVSCGKSSGALPGTLDEKMAPFVQQTLDHLEKFLGKGYLGYCREKQKVEIRAIEFMRGASLENCFVIVEEVQGLTDEQFQMLLTRIGENCTMVCTGDQRQSDIRGVNGLESTIKLIDDTIQNQPDYMDDDDLDVMESQIGVVRFTPKDVVRSGLVKAFVNMYFHQ
jgi:phosphate starvation-inducible PhoH-like protein